MVLSYQIYQIINLIIDILKTIQIIPGLNLYNAIILCLYTGVIGFIVYRLVRVGD